MAAEIPLYDQCFTLNVIVADSPFGDGAYAKCDIRKGCVVEAGLAIPFKGNNVDGNEWEFVFTWSDSEGNSEGR